MAIKTKKTFEQVLQSGQNDYKSLLDKVAKLQELNELIKQYLPEPLVNHCRIANLRKSKLVLAVDSPVWATKLRFYTPELLGALRQQPRFAGLAGVDVCVAPPITTPPAAIKPTQHTRRISLANRNLLGKLADTLQDERLKAVFKALSENTGDS